MYIVLKENPQVKPDDYIFYKPAIGMTAEEIDSDIYFIHEKLFGKPMFPQKGADGSDIEMVDMLLLSMLRELQEGDEK